MDMNQLLDTGLVIELDLNIYNEFVHLPNMTKLKKNDYQILLKKEANDDGHKFRGDTETEFNAWMKYIPQYLQKQTQQTSSVLNQQVP